MSSVSLTRYVSTLDQNPEMNGEEWQVLSLAREVVEIQAPQLEADSQEYMQKGIALIENLSSQMGLLQGTFTDVNLKNLVGEIKGVRSQVIVENQQFILDASGATKSLTSMLQESEQEIVVFLLWATWCKPCIEKIETINENFPLSDVNLISVVVQEPTVYAGRSRGLPVQPEYPVVFDPEKKIMALAKRDAVPQAIYMSKAGEVITVEYGVEQKHIEKAKSKYEAMKAQ